MAEIMSKNGEVVVTVTPDYHNAFVTLYPPVGIGVEITYEDVVSALAEKGVRFNIDTDTIKNAIEHKLYRRQIVAATWLPPVDGSNGSVKYFYETHVDHTPQADERGIVDYKNLGFIRIIDKGAVIAEIIPPTDGEPGHDVRGAELLQMKGKPAPYTLGTNTGLSEDGTKIIAKESGHLSYSAGGGFNILTTVTINSDIDAAIGNIDFIGDVVIKGEVLEGFRVSSSKNITISGNANGAELVAGGDITVKSGIINSTVTAHGNVKAQFCEYSDITCDGNLNAQSFVVCNVYCGGKLEVSKTLNGGKYTCLNSIEAASVGNPNYAPTDVTIGDNAVLTKEKGELEKEIADIDNQINRCVQIIDFLNEKKKQIHHLPDDKEELLGKSVKTKIKLQMNKKQKKKRISEIDERLQVKQYLSLNVKGSVYPGVRVTISDSVLTVDSEMRRTSIHLDADGLITSAPL